MIRFGSLALRADVKVISHCYPVPAKRAIVSCQSISTPSKLLLKTNYAKLFAVIVGSFPKLVGIYIFPNALIKIFIPLAL